MKSLPHVCLFLNETKSSSKSGVPNILRTKALREQLHFGLLSGLPANHRTNISLRYIHP